MANMSMLATFIHATYHNILIKYEESTTISKLKINAGVHLLPLILTIIWNFEHNLFVQLSMFSFSFPDKY